MRWGSIEERLVLGHQKGIHPGCEKYLARTFLSLRLKAGAYAFFQPHQENYTSPIIHQKALPRGEPRFNLNIDG